MSKNQMFKHETCEKSIKTLRGLNLGQLTLYFNMFIVKKIRIILSFFQM